jgi:hypothetical protein
MLALGSIALLFLDALMALTMAHYGQRLPVLQLKSGTSAPRLPQALQMKSGSTSDSARGRT